MARTDATAADDATGQARPPQTTNAGKLNGRSADRVSSRILSGERAQSLVGLLTVAGAGLLVASELTDRLEHLEGNIGMGAINLTVALLLASLVLGTAALIGDSALARAERHMGRRPGTRLVTPLLAAAGAVGVCGIVIDHLRHAPALDGWIGISGGVLLLLAAIAHHHYRRVPHAHPHQH